MRSLRDSSDMAASVDVLEVALLALERRDRGFGGIGRERLHVGEDTHQCRPDILRHRFRVAADVEAGATIEPLDDLAAALPQPVLDIDLLGRVAGEGEVEAAERTVGERVLPFELVEEVVSEAAIA